MRKFISILLIVAVLAAAGWFGYQRVQDARAAATPSWEVVKVVRDTILATVSATGAVLPQREASLAFQTTGTVASVEVEVGSQVNAGQVLVRLDTTDLELAVRQAEISLRQAQAQLRQLQEGPSTSDVAAAQAALESAQAAYEQLLRGADKDQLAAARAQVEQAKATLDQAQQAYDRVKDRPDVGLLPQSLQLQQATINYNTAEAQYRVAARGATASQIAAAQAQVVQAQASLDRLQRGPSAEQLAIAQAGEDQAQLALEQAQRRLQNAQLVAPWAGVVTNVTSVVGALAQPAAPAVQLADVSRFHLDVQVDEVDVAGIRPDQPVQIEVDALPDIKFTGRVARVAPAATATVTGGVSYKVRIDIDSVDPALRAGMSATATIIANTLEGVLMIPNRAVQYERETGRTFVERLVNGEPQRIEVRLGLRDEQRSEVREGLREGDEVIIRNRTGLQQLQQTFSGFSQ